MGLKNKNNRIRPFRAWVQEIAPQLYSDALSYHELLANLFEYLNGVIDSENEMLDNVDELKQTYDSLVKTVTEEIGYLYEQLQYYEKIIQQSVSDFEGYYTAWSSRVDTSMSTAEGNYKSLRDSVNAEVDGFKDDCEDSFSGEQERVNAYLASIDLEEIIADKIDKLIEGGVFQQIVSMTMTDSTVVLSQCVSPWLSENIYGQEDFSTGSEGNVALSSETLWKDINNTIIWHRYLPYRYCYVEYHNLDNVPEEYNALYYGYQYKSYYMYTPWNKMIYFGNGANALLNNERIYSYECDLNKDLQYVRSGLSTLRTSQNVGVDSVSSFVNDESDNVRLFSAMGNRSDITYHMYYYILNGLCWYDYQFCNAISLFNHYDQKLFKKTYQTSANRFYCSSTQISNNEATPWAASLVPVYVSGGAYEYDYDRVQFYDSYAGVHGFVGSYPEVPEGIYYLFLYDSNNDDIDVSDISEKLAYDTHSMMLFQSIAY